MSVLLGKKVYITDPESVYYGEWGIIVWYDGDTYHIAIAEDKHHSVIFNRNQFRIPRPKKAGDR